MVIAIIAILAAILFPVFARAREKARQTSCLSNLKQITLATLMYSQDYDETVPWPHSAFPSSAYNQHGVVEPYVKNAQIFECPSGGFTFPASGPPPSLAGRNSGYGHNYTGCIGGSTPYAPLKLAEISRPVDLLMWVDAGAGYTTAFGASAAYQTTYYAYNDNTAPVGRHNEGCNIGFMDGHAKWMTMSSFDGRNTADINRYWAPKAP